MERVCIGCCEKPCTVRFDCGHSCFCSRCCIKVVKKVLSSGVGSKCPCCREEIVFHMLENKSWVATEDEFIKPRHNQRPGAPEHLSVLHSAGLTDDEFKDAYEAHICALVESVRAAELAQLIARIDNPNLRTLADLL
jgi:hypothetical protein